MEVFTLAATVHAQHPFQVDIEGIPPELTKIDRPGDLRAELFYGDEQISPQRDLVVTLQETAAERQPVVLSYVPSDSSWGITPCGCRPWRS